MFIHWLCLISNFPKVVSQNILFLWWVGEWRMINNIYIIIKSVMKYIGLTKYFRLYT